MNSQQLKELLKKDQVLRIVNRNIFSDDPICFNNKNTSWELREEIANYFNISVKRVEIVGSGKIGISLKEEQSGKAFDVKSDIDVLIVSNELMEDAWKDLLRMEFEYYKLTQPQREFIKECYETIPRGFLSPERLPKEIKFHEYWWRIFSNVSGKKKYDYRKIRGRLFKDWLFAAKYYSIGLEKFNKEKKNEN